VSAERISELEYVLALDLETAGTEEDKHEILEVAAVFGRIRGGVFEPYLHREQFNFVMPVVSDVTQWHPAVVDMHSKNGLLAEAVKLRQSIIKESAPAGYYTLIDRDRHRCDDVLTKAASGLPDGCKWTLLGNLVHFDLRFVRKNFLRFSDLLSHRVLDVSAIRLFTEMLGRPYVKGEPAHRAMPDVQESLRFLGELRDWTRGSCQTSGAFIGQSVPFPLPNFKIEA
jgi:oligoribonuclease (3'-5' exoribonuclease)